MNEGGGVRWGWGEFPTSAHIDQAGAGSGWEWDKDWMWAFYLFILIHLFIYFLGGGGGLPARHAALAVTEGRQVLLGGGWIKEINTR